MNTPTELDEFDSLIHERAAAENISPWHGSLPEITSRGRQLRRRRRALGASSLATALGASLLAIQFLPISETARDSAVSSPELAQNIGSR